MKKTDLTQLDGMYYVGHLIDMDGSGYVDEETYERTNLIRIQQRSY